MLFYKNYIIYYNVYFYYCGVFIEKYVCTKFHRNCFVLIGCCVSELHAIYVAIVMYCRRLFIVVLQELHCLPNCLHVCMIRV